jgi:formamidopyrimidine-DNA glycosylase
MPELPEVEAAAVLLRAALAGRCLTSVDVLHAAPRRGFPDRARAAVAGRRITAVSRRGKHQLVHLDDGALLHVHFRMTGDWAVLAPGDAMPPRTRVLLTCTDGARVALVDPRALATIAYVEPGRDALPALGLEASEPSLDGRRLGEALAGRRGPIKPVLLDQRVIAGLGNIYAAEALWLARIDPRAGAATLGPKRRTALASAIRSVMRRAMATAGRYADGAGMSPRAYDRAGKPCRRCRTRIRRIVQAGRSTFYCPGCQRR